MSSRSSTDASQSSPGGGTRSWLSGLDVRYADILELFSTEEFARHRELSEKQRTVHEFDERVVEALKQRLDMPTAKVLHPSLLFQSYYRFLKSNQLAYPLALRRGVMASSRDSRPGTRQSTCPRLLSSFARCCPMSSSLSALLLEPPVSRYP